MQSSCYLTATYHVQTMSHQYREISPNELTAPSEMEPAAVLRTSLTTIAGILAHPIHHLDDSDALYLASENVQLALVSFNEQPDEVHVYIADKHIPNETSLKQLLNRLPLTGTHAAWWTRNDQPTWPGNTAHNFVIQHTQQKP